MAIEIDKKPPERRFLSMATMPLGGGACCCCCCCCLHSVGGLIGAMSARVKPLETGELPISSTDRQTLEPKTSAAGLYWAIVSILSGLLVASFGGFGKHIEAGEVALIVAIFLPGVQLAASIVAVVVLSMSKRVGTNVRMAHLGRITLRAFVGALIGGVIMLIPLLLR